MKREASLYQKRGPCRALLCIADALFSGSSIQPRKSTIAMSCLRLNWIVKLRPPLLKHENTMQPTVNAFIEKIVAFPLCARLLVAVNVGILFFALVMQHVFDVRPCALCHWQRLPYLCVGVLGAVLLSIKPQRKTIIVLLSLCALLYLSEFGIAIFHSGVERQLWAGTSSCAIAPLSASQSVEDLRRALLQTDTVPCNEISWALFGLSMANYNIAIALALAFFCVAAAIKASEQPTKA